MRGPGQPPHEPTDQTRAQVAAMVAYGITAVEIGKVIGISDTTLRKYYREEIDTGTAVANAKVAESLYKKALADGPSAVTAAIFWMKTRAGWKETVRNEVTGKDGEAVKSELSIDATKLSVSTMEELLNAAAKPE